MWLAERYTKAGSGYGAADVGVVSVGGAAPTVVTETERGSYVLLVSGGFVRLPENGEAQLTLNCADGTRAVIGAVANSIPTDLEAGEIYAETEHAAIRIKNDGTVEITGDVHISGDLTVDGIITQ